MTCKVISRPDMHLCSMKQPRHQSGVPHQCIVWNGRKESAFL